MSDIQQCRQIIAQLERDYNQEHKTTFIDIVPDKIIEISTMALWAQSISGAKKMDLGLPAPKAWLRKLAARGPAEQAETYKGVMFAFIKLILIVCRGV
ncbi:hypothetical protein NUU61_000267 [Penicillium alfredii]|uniref:Uncharacterized protein n=1 Tax=Penicillium alfredii TaxID=1506179 RepID=A0A9W9KQW9_9EURO|nr:uncharacterized protein NUU61_000267 [Penicillium alfredii]KAJ5114508.1 hypothetical protein NUU61_000267 [Penicillium alfredii]